MLYTGLRTAKGRPEVQAGRCEWPDHLPLGSATEGQPHEDNGISSVELHFGAALSLPAEYISAEEPPAQQFLKRAREAVMPATLIKRQQNCPHI